MEAPQFNRKVEKEVSYKNNQHKVNQITYIPIFWQNMNRWKTTQQETKITLNIV